MSESREQVQSYIEQLKLATLAAVGRDDYSLATRLGEAVEALNRWLAEGTSGPCPVDAPRLLAEAHETAPVLYAHAPAPEMPPSTGLVPPPAATPIEPERELLRDLTEARDKAEQGDYDAAESALNTILHETRSDELKQQASTELAGVRQARTDRLQQRLDKARQVARDTPGNLSGQRVEWEKVLALQPDHPEALDALSRLGQQQALDKLRQQIDDLRAPLRAVRRDIREVESARNEAHRLLWGAPIPDPELRRELEEVHTQLNALRDEILRASQGGASMERAGQHKKAIETYTAAVRAGHDVILDDTTGEPVEVVKALDRARQAYWLDLRQRAEQRVQAAQQDIAKGVPKSAVDKLVEAEGLVQEIERGGEDIRQQVQELLSQSRAAQGNYEEAQRLVTAAEADSDLEKARAQLLQARQVYPDYPRLDELIAEKERLLLFQVVRDMTGDLTEARGALRKAYDFKDEADAQAAFERARTLCRQAQQRGASLSITSPERDARHQEVERLLQEINEREAAYHKLLDQLQQLDAAIEAQDTGLVEGLLAGLSDEERQDWRVKTRRDRLTHQSGDRARYTQAEQFFHEHDYKRVVAICNGYLFDIDPELASELDDLASTGEPAASDKLQEQFRAYGRTLSPPIRVEKKLAGQSWTIMDTVTSYHVRREAKSLAVDIEWKLADFRAQATALRQRAEARLWLEEARHLYRQGQLDETIRRFAQVEDLHEALPLEDVQNLCERAKEERALAETAQKQLPHLQRRLQQVQQMRQDPSWVDWPGWFGKVNDLLAEAPDWLRGQVQAEYDEGTTEWKEKAKAAARQMVLKKDYHGAHETLAPLAQSHLLAGDDPDWRHAQYLHYTAEAEDLLRGANEGDWEQAKVKITDARNYAPTDRVEAAQTNMLAIIRRATLKSADVRASSHNPGPPGAITYLEGAMAQYPILKRDTEVRSRLLRYCLDVNEVEQAKQQAATMSYVTGEEKVGPFWLQLVQAATHLQAGRHEQAVGILVDMRNKELGNPGQGSTLPTMHQYMVEKVLTDLRQHTVPTAEALSDEELVRRIQFLDLIVQLDPADKDAVNQTKAMSARLRNLVNPLCERGQEFKESDSLVRTLNEGERLLSELQAVGHALERTGGTKELLEQIREVQEVEFQPRIEKWRTARAALLQIEELWPRVIGGAWEQTKDLETALAKVSRYTNFGEVLKWQERIGLLKQGLERFDEQTGERGLIALLKEIHEAWRAEQPQRIITGVVDLQRQINALRIALDEKKFVVPDSRLEFFDTADGTDFSGLEELQRRARQKMENLTMWQVWSQDLERRRNELTKDWEEILAWTTGPKLRLTDTSRRLSTLYTAIGGIREWLGSRPTEALSQDAEKYAEAYRTEAISRWLDEQVRLLEEKRGWLEPQLATVEGQIGRMSAFMKGKALSNERARKELRKMFDVLWKMDCSHPKISEFTGLLAMFGEKFDDTMGQGDQSGQPVQ